MNRSRPPHRSAVAGVLTGAVLAALGALALAPGAGATMIPSRATAHVPTPRRHGACSPSAGTDHPRILSPCAGATLDVAHDRNFTVRVYDADAQHHQYRPWLFISRGGRIDHGLLIGDGNGIDVQMDAVAGRPDEFEYDTRRLPDYDYRGFWRVTSGSYRIEVQQISDAGNLFSPIEPLRLRA